MPSSTENHGAPQDERVRTVRAVHNAMAVLRVVCESAGPIGVTQVASQVNLSKPTVHALLATLRHERLIFRHADSRLYSPGWELAVLSSSIATGNHEVFRARQELPRLAEQIGETVFLAVPEEDSVVILESQHGRHPVQLIARPGSRVPVHASAAGKVALGWSPTFDLPNRSESYKMYTSSTIVKPDKLQDEIRVGLSTGYMKAEGEHQRGISSLAVPILTPGRGLVGIFATAMPTGTLTAKGEEAIVRDLKQAAHRVVFDPAH